MPRGARPPRVVLFVVFVSLALVLVAGVTSADITQARRRLRRVLRPRSTTPVQPPSRTPRP
ncbi:hypothetical protein EJ06DRAFT_531614 [Trichodelitschia bisporula]|uniref:Uncharacterized protein n=1 Tax=Trichodelitschia bisporula TaxID=703511 RepID=A0A6G1HTA6_9PEZI|nr:hypothetical protein EJ06DRAFT_531614 [Trichodelitschia bisporula]